MTPKRRPHSAAQSATLAAARTAALTAAPALAAALSAASATAQEAGTVLLDEITVTANTSDTLIERSGSTVEVATREDIAQSGAQTVAGFLDTLPGITVTSNGGLGTQTTLRVRGSSGRYLGVFVDGIDVNDPSATQIAFDFGTLMTDDVERIEVLKGAQSARYGSEAVAGVINITTNRATEHGTFHRFGAEYGSYSTSRFSYNLSHRGERAGLALTLSRVETDGFSAADENDGNSEADGHRAERLSFSGDYALNDRMTAGISGFWQDSETEYDEWGPVDGTTTDEVVEARSRGLRAYLQISSAFIDHEIAVSGYENDRLDQGSNAWGAFSRPFLGTRKSISYAGDAMVSDTVTLGFGGDFTEEEFEGESSGGRHIMRGIYAETMWAPSEALDVTVTLRHDDHSEFGGKTTGRLAAAYRPRPDVILRFAAGTGFRTPSPYELFVPVYGNAGLQPETSTNVEAGAEKRFDNGAFLRATLFRTEITDLIDYDFATSRYAQVEGTGRSTGVELSAALPLSERVTLSGNATFTDAAFASGARLNRVPETDVTVQLDADLTEQLRLGLSAQHVANMVDSGTRMPDYTVASASARYQLTPAAELYLRVENLFDEEYQTVRGYGTSDLAAYVGLRASF